MKKVVQKEETKSIIINCTPEKYNNLSIKRSKTNQQTKQINKRIVEMMCFVSVRIADLYFLLT
jgi:hypothetical protein